MRMTKKEKEKTLIFCFPLFLYHLPHPHPYPQLFLCIVLLLVQAVFFLTLAFNLPLLPLAFLFSHLLLSFFPCSDIYSFGCHTILFLAIATVRCLLSNRASKARFRSPTSSLGSLIPRVLPIKQLLLGNAHT